MQESLFTVTRLEEFVPKSHPLRAVRELAIVDEFGRSPTPFTTG